MQYKWTGISFLQSSNLGKQSFSFFKKLSSITNEKRSYIKLMNKKTITKYWNKNITFKLTSLFRWDKTRIDRSDCLFAASVKNFNTTYLSRNL